MLQIYWNKSTLWSFAAFVLCLAWIRIFVMNIVAEGFKLQVSSTKIPTLELLGLCHLTLHAQQNIIKRPCSIFLSNTCIGCFERAYFLTNLMPQKALSIVKEERGCRNLSHAYIAFSVLRTSECAERDTGRGMTRGQKDTSLHPHLSKHSSLSISSSNAWITFRVIMCLGN